jgi:GTP pyrophosphokinase
MVQVRDAYPLNEQGQVDISRWIQRLPIAKHVVISHEVLEAAARFALQHDNTPKEALAIWGEGYSRFLTGLEMAEILTDLNVDQDTLVAAILYRTVRDNTVTLDIVRKQFGEAVGKLIDGVVQMATISKSNAVLTADKILGQNQAQPDHIRKMLVAMVNDVRVALIKLAERTCAIRAVKNNPERRYKVAREVFEVYAPLAHRLGIGHIKWELEDLSFRYLEPEAYKHIAAQLDERRMDRQKYIDDIIAQLREEIKDANINGEVFGRVKHIYSIWRKMQRKNINFSQVYDVRAVRVLVKEVRDCYTVLGIVHTLWHTIPKEFDDYIAMPKENGYRSLHTAVIGPDGKVVEIQIRTYDMHNESEFGVCAHWQYKGADHAVPTTGYEEKIAWLKQVLDESESEGTLDDLADELAYEVTEDKIYVFTPEGHVVELGNGATPLDFAYRVHTEVGHRCRGAKVNGRIVPLTYRLETGQQVDIITSKEAEPSREWLRPSLGYLKTSRARSKVKQWFKQRDKAQNMITGKALLEREFKRLALTSVDYKAVASSLGYPSVEDMYSAVGAGDSGTGPVLKAAQALTVDHNQLELSPQWRISEPKKPQSSSEIQVYGAGNMLTQMANCCKPLPGDLIGGYVTIGRGVSVHRQDCQQFLHLQDKEPERIIQVGWGHKPQNTYPVDIYIEAYDRSGLLRDVSTLLANERINVLAMKTQSNQELNTADMQVTLEIRDLQSLSRILAVLNQLPNIISVQRIANSRLL